MSKVCVDKIKQEMYNSFQAVLDAYALVGNSTESSKDEEQIKFQNYLNLRNKFCENYLEKALTICLKNVLDTYEALPVFTDYYRKMNTQYAFHVLNDANEIDSRIIQPFGEIAGWYRSQLVELSNITDTEITLTFTSKRKKYNDDLKIYGYGELTKDGLIFHCDDYAGSSRLDWLCNSYQSLWGNVVKMGFEDLGEFEELGENKYKRNMLLSTTAAVNRSLSYLPNLINLIDLSFYIVLSEGRKWISEDEICHSSYFGFGVNPPKITSKLFEDWKAYCSTLWDVVKENLCVTDSRRIIFKLKLVFNRNTNVYDEQQTEESFNDLQSFIEWYVNFRYNEVNYEYTI